MSHRGLSLVRNNVLDSIQCILNKGQRPTPFTENRPGSSWFKLFLKRHPSISEKLAETITRSRQVAYEAGLKTPENI